MGLTLVEDRFYDLRSGAGVGHHAPDCEGQQNARFSLALKRAFSGGCCAINDKVDYAQKYLVSPYRIGLSK